MIIKRCKYAFDESDEYCSHCNGVSDGVLGGDWNCTHCAGYEEGEEAFEVDAQGNILGQVTSEQTKETTTEETNEEKTVVEEEPKSTDAETVEDAKEETTDEQEEIMNKPVEEDKEEPAKQNQKEEPKQEVKKDVVLNKDKKVVEKKAEVIKEDVTTEIPEGVKVTSIRYLSSVTVMIDNNYYKLSAEEEWDVSNVTDVESARKALWNKLNSEVDAQIADVLN